MRYPSKVAAAAALAALAVALPTAAAGDTQQKVRVPKSGTWSGPRNTVMVVSGKTIDLLAFNFPCHKAKGRTSLNSIPLRKTKRGYKFSLSTHGNVTYSDDRPDQNGSIDMSGQFNRRGRKVAGRFQVVTKRCGSTGKLDWSAEYAPGA